MSNAAIDPAMFAIKHMTQQSGGPCAVCRKPTDPSTTGVGVFLANSYDPVCDQCAIDHAPTLAALVTMYHTIGGIYVRNINQA